MEKVVSGEGRGGGGEGDEGGWVEGMHGWGMYEMRFLLVVMEGAGM